MCAVLEKGNGVFVWCGDFVETPEVPARPETAVLLAHNVQGRSPGQAQASSMVANSFFATASFSGRGAWPWWSGGGDVELHPVAGLLDGERGRGQSRPSLQEAAEDALRDQ